MLFTWPAYSAYLGEMLVHWWEGEQSPLMECMQTSSKDIMFCEPTVEIQVLFLMWNLPASFLQVGWSNTEQQHIVLFIGSRCRLSRYYKSRYLILMLKKFSAAPFYLQREALPFRYVCKTSHTCFLVSGKFLSSIVFPAGACFSRLEWWCLLLHGSHFAAMVDSI